MFHVQKLNGKQSSEDDGCQCQSPINICREILQHDKTLSSTSINFDYKIGDIESVELFANNGFRCIAQTNSKSTISATHLMPDTYRLHHFHAHWGKDCHCGSEHTVEGKPFSGEIHIVFINNKYESFDDAVKYHNGLAVLGIFLKETRIKNEAYSPLLEDCLKEAIRTKQRVAMPANFDLNALLPENRNFFTYTGSLTTAPFSECVTWTLFKHSVKLSNEQMEIFREICTDNWRSIQPANGRTVRCSFRYTKAPIDHKNNTTNSTKI